MSTEDKNKHVSQNPETEGQKEQFLEEDIRLFAEIESQRPPEKQQEEKEEDNKNNERKKPLKAKRHFNMRSLKYGTASIVLTVVFVAAIVLLNVIVGLLSERFDAAADLTDAGLYTIGKDTESYISSLEKDVSITVLNSESDFEGNGQIYKQVNEVLKKIAMANENVSLNYLILDQNPNYTSQFRGETLSSNYIVVECENTERHRIISPYDYFSFNQDYLSYGQYIVEGSNIEQEAVSALMYVTNDDPVRVAFTEGYGEMDGSALSNLLTKNGYEVETINLANIDAIDPEIDFVVMFAPTLDVDNEQLAKLDRFLDNGGAFGKNVLYFASAQQPQTPNIEAFLNDWGISVGYSVIGQSDSNHIMSSLMGQYAHFQQIANTDYAGNTYGSSLFMYGADIRPVIQIWEGGNKGGVEQTVLMTTYDGAFLYPLDAGDDWDYNTAESGVFNDAVTAYRLQSDTQALSRLTVFGSEMFASSYFMQASNANNQDFFINMFNFISGKEEGISIKPKSFTYVGFDMNEQQSNILAVVLCIVIPVIVIAAGIVIWVRRRHK